ncbi:MAG: hypothetical protein H6850_04280 [Alphaproteobacteria bacterium]|nr:MAG: hypothetical protein H6850_04280 [Alphaproteobacteria bacterium]
MFFHFIHATQYHSQAEDFDTRGLFFPQFQTMAYTTTAVGVSAKPDNVVLHANAPGIFCRPENPNAIFLDFNSCPCDMRHFSDDIVDILKSLSPQVLCISNVVRQPTSHGESKFSTSDIALLVFRSMNLAQLERLVVSIAPGFLKAWHALFDKIPMPRLKTLKLPANQCSTNGEFFFSKKAAQALFPTLKHLRCQLVGNTGLFSKDSGLEVLTDMRNLETLEIVGINSKGLLTLGKILPQLTHLSDLSMEDWMPTDPKSKDLNLFFKSLGPSPQLKTLRLSIDSDFPAQIDSLLNNLPSLKLLVLKNERNTSLSDITNEKILALLIQWGVSEVRMFSVSQNTVQKFLADADIEVANEYSGGTLDIIIRKKSETKSEEQSEEQKSIPSEAAVSS